MVVNSPTMMNPIPLAPWWMHGMKLDWRVKITGMGIINKTKPCFIAFNSNW
jgi:hypothetical protein